MPHIAYLWITCCLYIINFGSHVHGNSFSRSGDPRFHCLTCKDDNQACPLLQDTVNITCPLGIPACVKVADNAVYKVTGTTGLNAEIFGVTRSCLGFPFTHDKSLFGIPSFTVDGCYRNLKVNQRLTGGLYDGALLEFKGDVCVCTSNLCNGSRRDAVQAHVPLIVIPALVFIAVRFALVS